MGSSGVLNDMMTALSLDNPNLMDALLPFLIAQAFGFGIYVYAILIQVKEKKSCYPSYVHTFFLALDSFGAVYWFRLAKEHDWFWIFLFYSVALAVWVGLEIWSLAGAVKHERQEIWGKYSDSPVTIRTAVFKICGESLFFLSVIMMFSYFMGGGDDASVLKIYVWSNIVLAFFPGFLWAERKSREGASVGLAIMILLCEFATFAPNKLGMWTAISPYFNTPAFYFCGIMSIGFAAYQLILLLRMPPKPKMINGKKAIW